MRKAPLISVGIICGDVCTITLYSQETSVQKMDKNNKRKQEQTNKNLGSSPGDTTKKIVVNNILSQTNKLEMAQYLHDTFFSPKRTILLKETKLGFLKTWLGLIEGLVNMHMEKLISTTLGHLHTRRQGLKSTREKTPYSDLEDK